MKKQELINQLLSSIKEIKPAFCFSFFILIICSSCLPDGRDGLPPVSDFTRRDQGNQSRFCQDHTTVEAIGQADSTTCFSECPDQTSPGSPEEIDALNQDIDNSNNTEETKDLLRQMVEEAAVICFPREVPRPDKQVFIQSNFCACLEGLPDVLNDCRSYCSDRNTSDSRLFGEVLVGPDIEENSDLRNLHGWCSNEMTGNDQVSPRCVLEVWSDRGDDMTMGIQTFEGSNRFETNISSLRYGRSYVARIVEVGSGASSTSFHLRRSRFSQGDDDPEAPLKIMYTSMYTCLDRTGACGQIDDPNEIYLCARRQYYYFAANIEPPAMPPGEKFLICHDLNDGQNDNELFDRFELRARHLAMWDQSDHRFIDETGQGTSPQINRMIQDRLATEFQDPRDQVNIFGLFQWPNRPGSGQVNVGFYMQPWIDQQTGRSFCPGQQEYQSNDNLFKVLGEAIGGIETEGLFLAVGEAESSDTTPPLLLIRENLLKEIWFYRNNGQHYPADEVTAGQRTIRFYWPPEPGADPLQRKAHQRLFTIRYPDEISTGATSGIPTTRRPPDKRIGCIPAID